MDIGLTILKGVRAIFVLLDWAVYSLINVFYTIFYNITEIRLFKSVVEGTDLTYIQAVAKNIYIWIGIVALFKIVFALITMIANPDMVNDKQKGGGKIVVRFLTCLILTIAVPTIFEMAYEFQEMALKQNVVGDLFSVGSDYQDLKSDSTGSSTKVSAGGKVANTLFKAFITPNTEVEEVGKEKDCINSREALESIDGEDEKKAGIKNYIKYINDTSKNQITKKNDFCNDYLWGLSTIAGGFAAWVFLIYCLDIAIRAVKLSFLELIAPVPIVSYITSDGKDGPFQKWVTTCISTYVDVFLRLLIINFIVQIIPQVAIEIFSGEAVANLENNPLIKSLAIVALILGILAFAKQAPDLIKDLFGGKGKGGDFGFGVDKLKQRTAPIGAAGAVATTGISNAAKTTRDTFKAQKDAHNGTVVSALKAAVAGGGSAFGGMAKATTVAAGMLGKKDAQIGQVYNKAFSTAVNNRDNRDKRQTAGYTFADNMLDKGKVLLGLDPKAKKMSDTYSNIVTAKQGNASELRQAAFNYATSVNMNQDSITKVTNLIKDGDQYYSYDDKGRATPVDFSSLNPQEQDFRKMLDASDVANVEAIKLGKIRDEMGRIKDNVTSNVKDQK